MSVAGSSRRAHGWLIAPAGRAPLTASSVSPSTPLEDVPVTHEDQSYGQRPVGRLPVLNDDHVSQHPLSAVAGSAGPGGAVRGTARRSSWISVVFGLVRWGPSAEQFPAGPAISPPAIGSIDPGATENGQDLIQTERLAADAAAAMAAAVRQELISPGSVSPEEQLRLTLADRGVSQLFREPPPWGVELRSTPWVDGHGLTNSPR